MLTINEIQEMNHAMLGLGAPIERDGVGYNKPDYNRMIGIGMLIVELSVAEAYVTLNALLRYKNTQLSRYKDDLEESYSYYQNELNKMYSNNNWYIKRMIEAAINGDKHDKKDYRKRDLLYYEIRDGYVIVALQEFVSGINIRDFNALWCKTPTGKSGIKVPVDSIDDFLQYISNKGSYGYQATQKLLDDVKAYREKGESKKSAEQIVNETPNQNNDTEQELEEIIWKIGVGIISKEEYEASKAENKNKETTEVPKNNSEEKTKYVAVLSATGKVNDYGHDIYELSINNARLNRELWKLKGKGLKYVDSKADSEKVFISTTESLLPALLSFLKKENVDVSPVTDAPAIDRNKSDNTLIDINSLDLPFKPYDFQVEDARTIVGKKKAMLGHDMGCGKTFISTLVGMSIPEKKLVICPETLRLNWKKELEQANKGADIKVIYSKDKTPVFGKDWTIMGYKTAVKFADLIRDEHYNCMFVDEAHKCKAVNNFGKPSSKQAQTVMDLAQGMTYTYLLTGTPMPTRNKDLYNELIMLGEIKPNAKYAFHRFGVTYCNGHNNGFGWDYNGSSNIEELHDILCKYMTRRLKSDVLPNLTKQRMPIFIETPLSREYRDIEKRLHCMSDGDTYMGLAMAGRRLLSKCKVDSAIELADTIVESEESVVLVAEFDETLDKMMEHYGDEACCIRGGMSDTAKQKAIDEFQSGQKKVCCINLIAAGVGITLTKAHNMVICDYDWTPANMTQVEDRICRTGQNEHCNIFYICHEGAILDKIFIEMITNKSENIDRVVDDAKNTVDLIGMVDAEKSSGSSGASDYLKLLKKRVESEKKPKTVRNKKSSKKDKEMEIE